MSPSTAIRRDAAVIIIEGDEFLFLDRARVKEMLAWPTLLEMRNIYPIKTMKALGFRYVYVARPVAGLAARAARGMRVEEVRTAMAARRHAQSVSLFGRINSLLDGLGNLPPTLRTRQQIFWTLSSIRQEK